MTPQRRSRRWERAERWAPTSAPRPSTTPSARTGPSRSASPRATCRPAASRAATPTCAPPSRSAPRPTRRRTASSRQIQLRVTRGSGTLTVGEQNGGPSLGSVISRIFGGSGHADLTVEAEIPAAAQLRLCFRLGRHRGERHARRAAVQHRLRRHPAAGRWRLGPPRRGLGRRQPAHRGAGRGAGPGRLRRRLDHGSPAPLAACRHRLRRRGARGRARRARRIPRRDGERRPSRGPDRQRHVRGPRPLDRRSQRARPSARRAGRPAQADHRQAAARASSSTRCPATWTCAARAGRWPSRWGRRPRRPHRLPIRPRSSSCCARWSAARSTWRRRPAASPEAAEMGDELATVLRLVSEGKLSAEEAAPIIEALGRTGPARPPETPPPGTPGAAPGKGRPGRRVRIQVSERGGESSTCGCRSPSRPWRHGWCRASRRAMPR